MNFSQKQFENQVEEINRLKHQLEQSKQAYDCLYQQLQNLLRHRFGTQSERDIDPNDPQGDFFIEDHTASHVEPEEHAEINILAHTRKVKKKKDLSQYPRIIEIIPVPDDEKQCSCGCMKKVIRHEIKELFDYIPAVFRIVEQRREVVACPKGCGTIQTAPAPLHVLPKVKATESLLAHVVVSKFHNRQPLYHLEKYGHAVEISRKTMASWMIQLVTPLQPVFNLMKDHIIDYNIASIDATTLQVLNEPGRPAKRKSYLYCLRGGPPDMPAILYSYNALKQKQFVDEWLEGFSGCIHMDADFFFSALLADPNVLPSYCNAHARRRFEQVKKLAKKNGLAHEAIRYYKKLYRVERYAKNNNMTAEQRYQYRQEHAKPIMDEFYSWLKKHQALVLPESSLGKAFAYAIKYEAGLCRYLEDGRLEIDNNHTEREIKPIVIARKNFMFAYSVAGAHAICMHMSLIRSAIANGLDPYQYYHALLKKIPHCQEVADYEALLPWNIDLS